MVENVSKILITTPDYPPKRIGGISTFVKNIEKAFKNINQDYDLLIYDNRKDLQKKLADINIKKYDLVINAHFHILLFINHPKMITFVHGGELLSYSKNIFKRIIKTIGHKNILSKLNKSYLNIFVSEHSLNVYKKYYGEVDYSKNIVFHNCIELKNSEFIKKDINQEINLCAFVRNVPHKNIKGIIELYQKLKSLHSEKVKLYISCNPDQFIAAPDEDIIDVSGISDKQKELIYQKSHLNILLSLDHTKIGNFEGFGLTVLEAGKYGVPSIGLNICGLKESIHHLETGIHIDGVYIEGSYEKLYKILKEKYSKLNHNVYEHTHSSHGLNQLERLFIGGVL